MKNSPSRPSGASQRPLELRITLNALEHLGLNLYSNIPAVLSEIVANAWDADAQQVDINLDLEKGWITICDDGSGMDRDAVIDRFLCVGYKRREDVGPETARGRSPMGRKGIGKLSIFSIAQTAEVFTGTASGRTAFRMDRDKIRQAVSSTPGIYNPEELETSDGASWPPPGRTGTRIVLSGLSKHLTSLTAAALKKRIARRFSVIGEDFTVCVDSQPIGPEDRHYEKAVEYVWIYGQKLEAGVFPNLAAHAFPWAGEFAGKLRSHELALRGWIGTVRQPSQLKGDGGDNLNRVAIFMRGKLAQEDILDSFGFKEIFADYVVGELHCDGLDSDAGADIATSSRQALKQDDPRYVALAEVARAELRFIANAWSELRRKQGIKQALAVPAVGEWLDGLQPRTREKAERWIGRLNLIRSADEADKKELLTFSILAFESYRRKEDLDRLDTISDRNIGEVLALFRDIDDLELSYYGQIVKNRVKVIETLARKVAKNDRELVIRDFIFDHLWLLDPSWERVAGSEQAEMTVGNFLKKDTKKLPAAERKARIDIGYRAVTGKHVIIELKRASVVVGVDDLVRQIRRYRDGPGKSWRKPNSGTGQLRFSACSVPSRRSTAVREVGPTSPGASAQSTRGFFSTTSSLTTPTAHTAITSSAIASVTGFGRFSRRSRISPPQIRRLRPARRGSTPQD